MSELHGIGSAVVVAAIVAYGCAGFFVLATRQVPRWIDRAWIAFLALVAAEAVSGFAAAVIGPGSSDSVHWVYGPALIVILVAGHGFALSTDARRRGAIMVVAATLLALVTWRLAATG